MAIAQQYNLDRHSLIFTIVIIMILVSDCLVYPNFLTHSLTHFLNLNLKLFLCQEDLKLLKETIPLHCTRKQHLHHSGILSPMVCYQAFWFGGIVTEAKSE